MTPLLLSIAVGLALGPIRALAPQALQEEVEEMAPRTRTYQRIAMFSALIKRLEGMRDKPGETYPLDAVERELLLEVLAALAKNSGEVGDR
jgi:hypothetical protein